MKADSPQRSASPGSSLLEAVIAMAVLAVAIPLVFGAIAESGKTTSNAEAETRSTWIVPACLAEIRASREGKPQYFTASRMGEVFPPAGEVWALGFSDQGRPLGKVSKGEYDSGARELAGEPVRYLASMQSVAQPVTDGSPELMRVRITLEFPAGVPAERRQKLDFHTLVP